jgi:hypothetical protein
VTLVTRLGLRGSIGIGAATVSLAGWLTACTTGPSLTTCGDAPRSSGPAATIAILTLTAPPSGRSGGTIQPQATLTVSSPVEVGLPVFVDIVRNGKAVGAYRGEVGGTGPTARPGPAASVNTAPLLLRGCPRTLDLQEPDATRQPLPGGSYQLVAEMEAGSHGESPSLIASAPLSFRIIS